MRQVRDSLSVSSPGQGLHEVTPLVAGWVEAQAIEEGLLTLFLRHTSASLLIQENADPDVRADLDTFFRRLVPEDERRYRHTSEGPDDMPAHIKAVLTQTHLSVPVAAGGLLLGTWQGIFLFEHRRRPHNREILLHLIGA